MFKCFLEITIIAVLVSNFYRYCYCYSCIWKMDATVSQHCTSASPIGWI